jgi:hypothetical protein
MSQHGMVHPLITDVGVKAWIFSLLDCIPSHSTKQSTKSGIK